MPRLTALHPNSTLVTLRDGAALAGTSAWSLRRLAVDAEEFTVVRDKPAQGAAIYLKRDECEVYGNERLPGLRRFRLQKRR